MEAYKLKIRIGDVRAKLRQAYTTHHRTAHFSDRIEAEIYCRIVGGMQWPYNEFAITLEQLEIELEELAGETKIGRWYLRKEYMEDLVNGGGIHADCIDRAAKFIELIDTKLHSHVESPPPAPVGEYAYLKPLLHPTVIASSWRQFEAQQYRDAVLNAFVAIGDLIRSRTGLPQDGKQLVEQAFSLGSPKLLLANLATESGRNEQLGFLSMMVGAHTAIRNPKAHSLEHDLDVHKTIHYLFLASLLSRRIADAELAHQSTE